MLSIKIETVVNTIVQQELVGKGRKSEALHFQFDLSLTAPEHHARRRCGLHLLYHSNPGWSTINVFSAASDSPFSKVKDIPSWRHDMSHDIEWRRANVFSRVYFDMASEVNAILVEHGRHEIAQADMLEYSYPAMLDCFYEWIPVRVSFDKSDRDGYHRCIELL